MTSYRLTDSRSWRTSLFGRVGDYEGLDGKGKDLLSAFDLLGLEELKGSSAVGGGGKGGGGEGGEGEGHGRMYVRRHLSLPGALLYTPKPTPSRPPLLQIVISPPHAHPDPHSLIHTSTHTHPHIHSYPPLLQIDISRQVSHIQAHLLLSSIKGPHFLLTDC